MMQVATQTAKRTIDMGEIGRAINSAVSIYVHDVRTAPEIPALPDASLRLLRECLLMLTHFVKSNYHDRRTAVIARR
jgi:hypothetical protein